MSHNEILRSRSKKISQFTGQGVLNDSDLITFVRGADNFNITFGDLKNTLGVTGDLTAIGDPLGTPILSEPTPGDFQIRNLESSKGIISSVSPQNGASLETNFDNGTAGTSIIENLSADQLLFRSISAGSGIAVGVSGDSITISSVATGGSNVVVVNSLSDFPAPIGGAINLVANTVYLIASNNVNISPNRIIASKGSVLIGSSVLTSNLTSNVAGDFITASDDIEINQLSINCPNATFLKYDSATPKNGKIIIISTRINDCDRIIDSKNHRILLAHNFGVTKNTTNGVLISGTCAFTLFQAILFEDAAGTAFDFGTSVSCVLEVDSAVVIPASAGTIIFDGLTGSGNIELGGSGTIRSNNIIGTFASTGNILPSDLRWTFIHSNVFQNSENTSYLAIPTNATVTTILVINTPVKIAGTWTDVNSSRFTNDTTGKITYDGSKTIDVQISVNISALKAGGGTDNYTVYIAKNGVVDTNILGKFSTDSARIPNIAFFGSISLSTTDFIEVFVENNSNINNITITSANILVKGNA